MTIDDIQILEKPEWVSWDDIHQVIWDSHAENRRKGIVMRYPSLKGAEIREKIGPQGIMLVALTVENKLVGTTAFFPKTVRFWFGKNTFAYCCFSSVLPEYNGLGIYNALCKKQEELAREMGLDKIMFDTHERNRHIIEGALRAGYKFVDLQHYNDHFNVALVKWLNGCPYSAYRCRIEFLSKSLKTRIKNSLIWKRFKK